MDEAALGNQHEMVDQAIVELPVTLRLQDVLRSLGYPPGRGPRQRHLATVEAAVDRARALVRCRGTYLQLDADRASSVQLELGKEATSFVLGLVTSGHLIEAELTDVLSRGETTVGLVLDAAGSVAAEEGADRLCEQALGPMATTSAPISCSRLSPGYGAWPLEIQAKLFDLLPAGELGVTLTRTMLMVPRKSITFAMPLDHSRRPIPGLSGCNLCDRGKTCAYRHRTRGQQRQDEKTRNKQ